MRTEDVILSVTLKNWKSHSETGLEFKKGTNLLVGIMGSGKSAVLDAISFALFGTFPALDRRKVMLENVIRNGEREAKVELELRWKGALYRIERMLGRKKTRVESNAIIYRDGGLIESGSEAVTNYIEDLLSIDYDLFTRAIYSEQNNIDYFLTLDPRKRKEEIDRLLGLDRFENARANAITVTNRISASRKLLETKFNKDRMKELENKQKEIMEKLAKSKDAIEKVGNAKDEKQQKIEKIEKEFLLLKEKRLRFETLRQEEIRLKGISESVAKEIGSRKIEEKELMALRAEKIKLEKEREEWKQKNRIAEDIFAALLEEVSAKEARLKEGKRAEKEIIELQAKLTTVLAEKPIESRKAELTVLEDALMENISKKNSLSSAIAETEELVGKLSHDAKQCPLCGCELNAERIAHVIMEKEALIKKRKLEISRLANEIALGKKKLEAERRTINTAELLMKSIEAMEGRRCDCSALEKEITEKKKKLEEMRAERKERDARVSEIEKTLERLIREISYAEELAKKLENYERMKKELINVSTALQTIGFDEKVFEAVRTEFEKERLEFEKLRSEARELAKEIENLKEIAGMIAREMAKFQELDAEIKTLIKAEEELLIYKNALAETQTLLRIDVVEAINSAMNEMWGIIYPYADYKSIRLKVDEKDYRIEVYDREWKPLESVASGGERACAALTLRIALSAVLTPNLSWLILDEPTHNLDREAVGMLADTLENRIPDIVGQTFVITHEESLMGSEFASSYKFNRNKEIGAPTVVEKL